jgi:MinD-like ATPase involved in chromosome partitioning or flagellar assembly
MSQTTDTPTSYSSKRKGILMTDTEVRPFAGAARAADYIEEATTQRPRPAPVGPDAVAPEPAPTPVVLKEPTMIQEPVPVEEPVPADEPVVVDEPVVAFTAADLFDTTGTSDGAKSGVRGLLAKVGIQVPAGRAELARAAAADRLREDETTIRQATFPRAVGVLVANRKGGAGKTPTSIILGGILASIRGGSVAVLEVSDDPGTLTLRSEGTPARGLEELIGDVDTVRTAGQLSSYTAPQTSFASVIGTVHRRRQLVGVDVARLSAVIDDHYAIRVMDSGNQPSSSAFGGAIATADVLVIPVLNSADTVLEALDLLDELRAWGGKAQYLADRAIIIRLIDGRLEQPHLSSRLAALLDQAHVTGIYEIPYDQHIAERGPITVASLETSTRTAFTAAAAGVIRTLQNQPLNH